MGRGHVVGIAGFAHAQQQHGMGVRLRRHPLQQGKGGGLADGNTIAVQIKRPAGLGGGQAQGVEAVQGGQAQGVNTAYHRSIDQTRRQHTACRGKYLGAG